MLLRALFVRPLLQAPLRFAATVVGVASGVALFVSTLASSRAAVASLAEGVLEISGDARLEITAPGGVDENVLGDLRGLAGRARFLPVVEELVLCTPERETARLFGIDPLVDDAARAFLATALTDERTQDARTQKVAREHAHDDENGPWIRTLRGEGAWVARDWAARRGWSVGSTIELTIGARPRALEILGLFDAPASASSWERAIVVDVALAQELCDRIGRLDRIEIVPRHAEPLEDLALAARLLVPAACTVAEPARRSRQTSSMVRSLEFNLRALSGISLFVGAVLVATTLASSVVARGPTLALLRSLGAGRGQIVRAVLVEAAAIGALGGALGVCAAYAASSVVLDAMRATFSTVVPGAPATPIRFELAHATLGLALGLGVSVLASILPLVEAARTPPIQAWRTGDDERAVRRRRHVALAAAMVFTLLGLEGIGLPAMDGLPIPALAGLMCFLCVLCALAAPLVDAVVRIGRSVRAERRSTLPLVLASAALAAGRRRAAFAAGAVGVAVALSISIATMVHSFRTTMVDWTEASLRADVSIRPFGPADGLSIGRLDPRIVEIAEATFGPECVDPLYAAEAFVGDERITFAGAAFDVVGARGRVPFRDGRDSREVFRAARESGRALVNEAFVNRFGVREGDTVELAVRGTTIARAIEGVFYDYGDSRGWVIVDRHDFLSFHPGEGPRDIALFLSAESDRPNAPARGSEASRARARDADGKLRAALGDDYQVEILDNDALQARVLDVFDRTFAITLAMEAVAALVAVIAVLSVLFALVWERRSDLALLRSLGASRRTVTAVVCAEAGLLGFLGAVSGAAIGLAMGVVLVRVVNLQSFGWTVHLHPPWGSVAAMILGVCVACIAAGLWPAAWVARKSLNEGLRVEG